MLLLAGAILAGCGSSPDAGPTPDPTEVSPAPFHTIAYGPGPDNVGDLRISGDGQAPVVVLLHGGFWREPFTRELMDDLARDLTAHGYVTWNLEYRRVGASGGGWPETALDVAAGIDHLAALADSYPMDLSRVIVLGHSAGGHLALWAAGRHRLPETAPGSMPLVRPMAVVSLAGVADLAAADERSLGAGAVAEFLGTAAERSRLYPIASPIELLPLGIPQLLVHGTEDRVVPPEQSERYTRSARVADDSAELLLAEGAGHFAVIDATSDVWQATATWIADLLHAP